MMNSFLGINIYNINLSAVCTTAFIRGLSYATDVDQFYHKFQPSNPRLGQTQKH